MSMLRLGLLVLAVLAAVGLMAFHFLQRSLMYFPSHNDAKAQGARPFLPWRDDRGTFLGYVRAAESPKQVVLFFHGNAGEAIDRQWIAMALPASTVLCLVEYPGYGARPGSPSEKALFTAAEEAFDEARKTWKLPILVIGESLGTGVASYVASVRDVDRIALISPFSSMLAVASYHYPRLPVRWLLRDRYLSTEHLARAKAPLAVIHGDADAVIPIGFARELFDKYTGKKAFFTLSGVGHNDIAYPLVEAPSAEAFRTFISAASQP